MNCEINVVRYVCFAPLEFKQKNGLMCVVLLVEYVMPEIPGIVLVFQFSHLLLDGVLLMLCACFSTATVKKK